MLLFGIISLQKFYISSVYFIKMCKSRDIFPAFDTDT